MSSVGGNDALAYVTGSRPAPSRPCSPCRTGRCSSLGELHRHRPRAAPARRRRCTRRPRSRRPALPPSPSNSGMILRAGHHQREVRHRPSCRRRRSSSGRCPAVPALRAHPAERRLHVVDLRRPLRLAAPAGTRSPRRRSRAARAGCRSRGAACGRPAPSRHRGSSSTAGRFGALLRRPVHVALQVAAAARAEHDVPLRPSRARSAALPCTASGSSSDRCIDTYDTYASAATRLRKNGTRQLSERPSVNWPYAWTLPRIVCRTHRERRRTNHGSRRTAPRAGSPGGHVHVQLPGAVPQQARHARPDRRGRRRLRRQHRRHRRHQVHRRPRSCARSASRRATATTRARSSSTSRPIKGVSDQERRRPRLPQPPRRQDRDPQQGAGDEPARPLGRLHARRRARLPRDRQGPRPRRTP